MNGSERLKVGEEPLFFEAGSVISNEASKSDFEQIYRVGGVLQPVTGGMQVFYPESVDSTIAARNRLVPPSYEPDN
jgi:hypothetical protein